MTYVNECEEEGFYFYSTYEELKLELVAFGKTAELLSQYTSNRDNIFIDGRLAMSTYNKKDGTKGYQFKIYVDKAEWTYKDKPANNNKEQESEQDIPF